MAYYNVMMRIALLCLLLSLAACKSTQGLSPQNSSAKADYSYVKPNTPGHLLLNSFHAFNSPCIHTPSGDAQTSVFNAIYEVKVKDGVSYQDVIDSLKSVSEGMNFVNPANFPIANHMRLRGVDPQGIKEVHSFCNLSMGTEIMLDHPEFLVFAPCRVALYEKPDANKKLTLFIGLARPTYDLKSIKNPTPRAVKAAQQLEDALIQLLDKASRGDI